MHLRVLVAVAGVPLASSHGQMMHPPNWFMTDGLPRVCPMSDGANWTLGAVRGRRVLVTVSATTGAHSAFACADVVHELHACARGRPRHARR